ncbi:MAG: hypothetical protein J0I99_12235 [Devosia sp.]|uniref:hypothetical protein n=1 Tax=Devosia sp. TaxID=1871048 RepID=UPI001AC0DCEE|nr:hypothetical protein [Devosia sp.]MBN9316502.1 hypothetical protein [Devosia sp.]
MDVGQIDTLLAKQSTDWDEIFAEVNEWRGTCLHHFSVVEVAVAETLLALSEVSSAAIPLRHLIGQRLEDLTAATAAGGPFEEAGKTAQVELLHYRERHEHFRNLLCHGLVKITVERGGRWMLVMRVLAFRSGKADRVVLVLDQNEAAARLESLKRDAQKLGSVLGQLRKAAVG